MGAKGVEVQHGNGACLRSSSNRSSVWVKLETRTSDVGLGVVGAGVGAGVGGITQHPHWLAPQLPG